MHVNQVATATMAELLDLLSKVDGLASQQVRRRPVLFVEWSTSVSVSLPVLHASLSRQLNRSYQRDVCLAELAIPGLGTDKKLMAFILKDDTAAILADGLELPACTLEASYIVKAVGRRDQAVQSAIMQYCAAVTESVTNLWLDEVPGNKAWGLDQLEAACSELNEEALIYIHAQIKLTDAKERDDFQKAFMKLLPELRALRAKKAVHTASSAITAKNVQQMVQPRSTFIEGLLNLVVIVPDLSLCPAGQTTLGRFFEEPILHQKLTLLMHGDTRLGKTEAAKMLAYALSSRYLEEPCLCLLFEHHRFDQTRAVVPETRPCALAG
jgi:hypothetical protein